MGLLGEELLFVYLFLTCPFRHISWRKAVTQSFLDSLVFAAGLPHACAWCPRVPCPLSIWCEASGPAAPTRYRHEVLTGSWENLQEPDP